ncbi:MAG: hypothetical protein N3A61_02420 [Ignavibacteria bacterium]|nr:hypothetical protein [Ignavibacteria bacterium]
MRYVNDPSNDSPSIVNSIRAFPRQFVLRPKQRQVVRMTVKSVDSLKNGTYWARIITSATPQAKPADSISTGIKAQLKFVLNQVTTVLYRTGEATTGLECDNIKVITDSNRANILIPMIRTGNSPFFSSIKVSIFDLTNKLVDVKEEFVPIYFEIIKRFSFELQEGKYKAEVRIVLNEKEDIPQSNLNPITPIIRNVEFSIP